MTMPLDVYEAACIDWVGVQLPGITAQFKNSEGPWQKKPRARLSWLSSDHVGVDFVHSTQDTNLPAGEDMVDTVSGDRTITLTVLLQTRNQDGDSKARYFLEKLRTSLTKRSVKAAFVAAGLAFSTAEAVVPLDRWVDDRMESQAALDIHFNAVVNERDTDEVGSFVETVGIAADLDPGDGSNIGWDERIYGNV